MVGTGRFIAWEDAGTNEGGEVEIDTDVLVTEQRLIELGLAPETARSRAAMMVHLALNAVCSCCPAETEPVPPPETQAKRPRLTPRGEHWAAWAGFIVVLILLGLAGGIELGAITW